MRIRNKSTAIIITDIRNNPEYFHLSKKEMISLLHEKYKVCVNTAKRITRLLYFEFTTYRATKALLKQGIPQEWIDNHMVISHNKVLNRKIST